MEIQGSAKLQAKLESLNSELSAHGWAGMAWACLRRNPRYRKAWQKSLAGEMNARAARAEFGLVSAKPPQESYEKGQPPVFVGARVYGGGNGELVHKTLRVRRKCVLIAPTEIAVIFSLEHNAERQWEAAKALIGARLTASRTAERGDSAPKRVREFGEMVRLLSVALLAFELDREGWGPTRIGVALFPAMRRAAAKTKSRDLVERGTRFVRKGYRTFVLESCLGTGCMPKGKAASKNVKETLKPADGSNEPKRTPKIQDEPRFVLIEPLPPLWSR